MTTQVVVGCFACEAPFRLPAMDMNLITSSRLPVVIRRYQPIAVGPEAVSELLPDGAERWRLQSGENQLHPPF